MTVHGVEFSELKQQQKANQQALAKCKLEAKCKHAEVKKQKKDNLTLQMNQLSSFSNQVSEEVANDIFTETVSDLHSKSIELEEEHATAEQHLHSRIQGSKSNQNPVYNKTHGHILHLKDELQQVIAPKQSYYLPPAGASWLLWITQAVTPLASLCSYLKCQQPALKTASSLRL